MRAGPGEREVVQDRARPIACHEILEPGKDWELVGEGYHFSDGLAVDKFGNVFFSDAFNNRIYKIDLDGKVTLWKDNAPGVGGMVFGPDGRLYAGQAHLRRIVAYTPDGAETVIAEDVEPNDLCVTSRGDIYFTDSNNGKVWFIDTKGSKRVVDNSLTNPNGIRTSPDESLLLVSDTLNKWVWSFQIQPDGSLADAVPFYRLETADDSSASNGDGMTVDTQGFVYVASKDRHPGLRSARPRDSHHQSPAARLARQPCVRRAGHAVALRGR